MPLLSLSSFSLIFFFSFLFDKGVTIYILHPVSSASRAAGEPKKTHSHTAH
jgi:hypothetical protein